jgi:hypothetical protein
MAASQNSEIIISRLDTVCQVTTGLSDRSLLNLRGKELMLRSHVQVQSLWSSERDEGLADPLPPILRVGREYPELSICSKDVKMIECQLVMQSALEGDVTDCLRNIQARSASTDLFPTIGHSAYLCRKTL